MYHHDKIVGIGPILPPWAEAAEVFTKLCRFSAYDLSQEGSWLLNR